MTSTDPATLEAELLRLRESAKAAIYEHCEDWANEDTAVSRMNPLDAAFIRACPPQLVLALLAAFDQQRAEIARLTEALREARAQGEKPL